MRTKDEILKELHKNRQPGMYGGIPPDTKDSILIEVQIDIRDVLVRIDNSFGSNILDLARES